MIFTLPVDASVASILIITTIGIRFIPNKATIMPAPKGVVWKEHGGSGDVCGIPHVRFNAIVAALNFVGIRHIWRHVVAELTSSITIVIFKKSEI